MKYLDTRVHIHGVNMRYNDRHKLHRNKKDDQRFQQYLKNSYFFTQQINTKPKIIIKIEKLSEMVKVNC